MITAVIAITSTKTLDEYFKENGSNAQDIKKLRDKLIEWKQKGSSQAELETILSENWDDLLDAGEASGLLSDDRADFWTEKMTNDLMNLLNDENVIKSYEEKNLANNGKLDAGDSYGEMMYLQSQYNYVWQKDGFAQGNGSSMVTSASKVTPINDGSVQLAKSHPQDSALFAKSGGPFDTLFNKVFAKVDAIYNGMGGSTSSQSLAPIQLNINGELNLKSGNQSIDLIGLMESNPQFVATMSQLIVTQLSKNVNGGKTGMFEYLRSI